MIIAILVVILVSLVIFSQFIYIQSDYNKRFKSIVNELNDTQRYEYNFDRRNKEILKQDLWRLENMKKKYLKKQDLKTSVSTMSLRVPDDFHSDSQNTDIGSVRFSNDYDPNLNKNQIVNHKNELLISGSRDKVAISNNLNVSGNMDLDNKSISDKIYANKIAIGSSVMNQDTISANTIDSYDIKAKKLTVGTNLTVLDEHGNINTYAISSKNIIGNKLQANDAVKSKNVIFQNDGVIRAKNLCIDSICLTRDDMMKFKYNQSPIDCKVTEWSDWTKCTGECDGGMRERKRNIITEPEFGGKQCPELYESELCNTKGCVQDCVIGEWSPWSACSADCGGGMSKRSRPILKYARNGGKICDITDESMECNMQPCGFQAKTTKPVTTTMKPYWYVPVDMIIADENLYKKSNYIGWILRSNILLNTTIRFNNFPNIDSRQPIELFIILGNNILWNWKTDYLNFSMLNNKVIVLNTPINIVQEQTVLLLRCGYKYEYNDSWLTLDRTAFYNVILERGDPTFPTTTPMPMPTTMMPTTTMIPTTTQIPTTINPNKLYDFVSHLFTNASAEGFKGPTLVQCRSAYSNVAWTQSSSNLDMLQQGIQIWKVPMTGVYKVTIAGAAGAGSNRGFGRKFSAMIQVLVGTNLKLLVGQLGTIITNTVGGGGGASYIATMDNMPVLVAPGGGGSGSGGRGTVITDGYFDQGYDSAGTPSYFSSGGASFTFRSQAITFDNTSCVALSFKDGGLGANNTQPGGEGGFGGGGGVYYDVKSTGTGTGGGGGGFAGGSAYMTYYNNFYSGQGGYSYYKGEYVVTTSATDVGTNDTHGSILIEYLVPLSYFFSTHTFTTCGITGLNGPTYNTCKSTYASSTWTQDTNNFTLNIPGYQVWTVPFNATYKLIAYGAASPGGGSGGVVSGDIQLTRGQKLIIICGQQGIGFGGSGGTYIVLMNSITSNTLLLAAGGGGGKYSSGSPSSSANGGWNLDSASISSTGGTSSSDVFGGSGFEVDANTTVNEKAKSFYGGFIGGSSTSGHNGGFGGGGAGSSNGGGGGGGYRGGNYGNSTFGQGGTNYANTQLITNITTLPLNTGAGYVKITVK